MQSSPFEAHVANVQPLLAAISAAGRPDPDLSISEWADQYRVLSRVSAGEPGMTFTTVAYP